VIVINLNTQSLHIQEDLTIPNYRKAFCIGMYDYWATYCILHWRYCWTLIFI